MTVISYTDSCDSVMCHTDRHTDRIQVMTVISYTGSCDGVMCHTDRQTERIQVMTDLIHWQL